MCPLFIRAAKCAGVAELADAPDLGSGGQPREGSSPFARTSWGKGAFPAPFPQLLFAQLFIFERTASGYRQEDWANLELDQPHQAHHRGPRHRHHPRARHPRERDHRDARHAFRERPEKRRPHPRVLPGNQRPVQREGRRTDEARHHLIPGGHLHRRRRRRPGKHPVPRRPHALRRR